MRTLSIDIEGFVSIGLEVTLMVPALTMVHNEWLCSPTDNPSPPAHRQDINRAPSMGKKSLLDTDQSGDGGCNYSK